jgi:hypothetical protein
VRTPLLVMACAQLQHTDLPLAHSSSERPGSPSTQLVWLQTLKDSGRASNDDGVVVHSDSVGGTGASKVGDVCPSGSVEGPFSPVLVRAEIDAGIPTHGHRIVVDRYRVRSAISCHVGEVGTSGPVEEPFGPVLVRAEIDAGIPTHLTVSSLTAIASARPSPVTSAKYVPLVP